MYGQIFHMVCYIWKTGQDLILHFILYVIENDDLGSFIFYNEAVF